MDFVLHIDHQLFFYVNKQLTHPWLDVLVPWLRNKYTWAPLYLFLFIFLIVNFGKKGAWAVLFFILTVALSDMLSSAVIKPYVKRLRPCNDLMLADMVRLLVPCGPGYSFPSSHACNHFAMAVFTGFLFFRLWRWILPVALLWAFSVAYAQVYVGVHFPLDVTAGALLGTMTGTFMFFLCKQYVGSLNT